MCRQHLHCNIKCGKFFGAKNKVLFFQQKQEKETKYKTRCLLWVSLDHVEVPVETDTPRAPDSLLQLLAEVLQSHIITLPKAQGLLDVHDIISGLELRNPSGEHHGEQVDEKNPMFPQVDEGIFAQLLEPEEKCFVRMCAHAFMLRASVCTCVCVCWEWGQDAKGLNAQNR